MARLIRAHVPCVCVSLFLFLFSFSCQYTAVFKHTHKKLLKSSTSLSSSLTKGSINPQTVLWPALRLFRSHIFSTQIFFYLTENPSKRPHQVDPDAMFKKKDPSHAIYPDFVSSFNILISVLLWMLHCVWFPLLRRHFPHISPELNVGLVFLLWFTHPSQLGSYNVWKWSSWHLLIPSATSLRVNHIWNNSVSVSVLSLVQAEHGTTIHSGEKGFNVKEKLKWIGN